MATASDLHVHEIVAYNYAHDTANKIHDDEFARATGGSVYSNANGDVWSDITPAPGTLVLFDSCTVPHEVVATKRSRVCIVGWLGSFTSGESSDMRLDVVLP